MIAVDTSSFIAYLQGDEAADTHWIEEALSSHALVFPPVVCSELLSDGQLPKKLVQSIQRIPLLTITSGYWYRAGSLRSQLLAHQLKARLADTLIAQSCIDHTIPLITRDNDFRDYVSHGSLKLFG